MNPEKKSFDIRFESGSLVFGDKTLGSPFNVYAPGRYLQNVNGSNVFRELRTWAFAVRSGDQIEYSWPLASFDQNMYHLRVYGPNGFYREYKGSAIDPLIEVQCNYQVGGIEQKKLTGNISLMMRNSGRDHLTVTIIDNAYKTGSIKKTLGPSANQSGDTVIPIDLSKQFGWYDFTVKVEGSEMFSIRYAGRVDTGEAGFSDPFMGRTI